MRTHNDHRNLQTKRPLDPPAMTPVLFPKQRGGSWGGVTKITIQIDKFKYTIHLSIQIFIFDTISI